MAKSVTVRTEEKEEASPDGLMNYYLVLSMTSLR